MPLVRRVPVFFQARTTLGLVTRKMHILRFELILIGFGKNKDQTYVGYIDDITAIIETNLGTGFQVALSLMTKFNKLAERSQFHSFRVQIGEAFFNVFQTQDILTKKYLALKETMDKSVDYPVLANRNVEDVASSGNPEVVAPSTNGSVVAATLVEIREDGNKVPVDRKLQKLKEKALCPVLYSLTRPLFSESRFCFLHSTDRFDFKMMNLSLLVIRPHST